MSPDQFALIKPTNASKHAMAHHHQDYHDQGAVMADVAWWPMLHWRPEYHTPLGSMNNSAPAVSFLGREAKSFENQQKREAPNPTVLPLETISLPCLILVKASAYGFRIPKGK